jgi:hypothetical protein
MVVSIDQYTSYKILRRTAGDRVVSFGTVFRWYGGSLVEATGFSASMKILQ